MSTPHTFRYPFLRKTDISAPPMNPPAPVTRISDFYSTKSSPGHRFGLLHPPTIHPAVMRNRAGQKPSHHRQSRELSPQGEGTATQENTVEAQLRTAR